MDVYIPPKRDKNRARFGFVRFGGVQNSKVLEVKLQEVQIGDRRVRVNLPRFDRNRSRAANEVQNNSIQF